MRRAWRRPVQRTAPAKTTSTQTIDVYYKDARWRQASVGWQYWGPPEATCPIDAGYRIRRGLAGTANYYHDFYAERIP